jgi:hypothetical protein
MGVIGYFAGMRCFAPLVVVFVLAASCGGDNVNCDALCTRTILCEVDFAPSDDPNKEKVLSGERTEQESCVIGCEENPAVTPDSARCVDQVTDASQDPAVCRDQVLACFEIPPPG